MVDIYSLSEELAVYIFKEEYGGSKFLFIATAVGI
jgi:hypothetical protein